MHHRLWPVKVIRKGLRPVRLADKPWLKVLFADLLWEKNTTEQLTDLAEAGDISDTSAWAGSQWAASTWIQDPESPMESSWRHVSPRTAACQRGRSGSPGPPTPRIACGLCYCSVDRPGEGKLGRRWSLSASASVINNLGMMSGR
jgi:hypothetical protein